MRNAFTAPSGVFPSLFRSLLAIVLVVGATIAFSGDATANAKYSGIVIDARTGKTLYSYKADARRYPASLTKMMTLYLMFEALESGRIKKSSRIPVSAYAAGRPPSKLGLRKGRTITVESAILALVTKSANDASTAVAEYLGGSETGFGKIMTRKARQLGMKNTVFRNPHGLPNSKQYSTARDMARLGIALREHFPGYYKYFSTRSFTYGKRRYGNHNKLLGNVRGVDGIKTGYTRASGFNLVTSARSKGRSIVAVVMGGRTSKSRNAQMRKLVANYLPKASKRGSGRLVARGPRSNIKPVTAASLPRTNAPIPAPKPVIASAAAAPRPSTAVDPVKTASTGGASGWVIQVASLPTQDEANRVLADVRGRSGSILADASPFTVTFTKEGILYHRARFAGFSGQTAALRACKALKKKKIACYAVEQ